MLTTITLPYTTDQLRCYQAYCKLPGFVLLESSDTIRGRYDILSAYPYDGLVGFYDASELKTFVESVCQKSGSSHHESSLPFQGGIIGFVTYDYAVEQCKLGREKLPQLATVPLVSMQCYDWAIVVDHWCQKVTLVSANRRSETADLLKEMQQRWFDVSDACYFEVTKSFSPLITQTDYQEAFANIHHALRLGRAYQVNYTQPFLAEYQGDPWAMYARVSRQNPVPFSAYIHQPQFDILSFSPERFLLMEGDRLLTSPIKGSARRSSDPLQDTALRLELEQSAKNRAENVMIVDLLRNDLGRIARPGSVQVEVLCEIQSFRSVHHLVSDISAQGLPHLSPIEVFLSCFPGGSITGAPKLEAMRIIQEHECFARGIYCGSIGYFSHHGRFDTSIAIRTAVASHGQLQLSAGGGIVIDSSWEEEYQECHTKIEAICRSLT